MRQFSFDSNLMDFYFPEILEKLYSIISVKYLILKVKIQKSEKGEKMEKKNRKEDGKTIIILSLI